MLQGCFQHGHPSLERKATKSVCSSIQHVTSTLVVPLHLRPLHSTDRADVEQNDECMLHFCLIISIYIQIQQATYVNTSVFVIRMSESQNDIFFNLLIIPLQRDYIFGSRGL